MRALVVGHSSIFENKVVSCLQAFPDIELVGIAGDGAEGISLAQQFLPELVVAQFDLPDMSGAGLTRVLKADSISPPAVILVSPTDDPRCGQLAYQAGADGHVTRPALGQLEPLVESLTGERRHRESERARHRAGPMVTVE